MIKEFLSASSLILSLIAGTPDATAQQVAPTTSDSVSTVYYIKDITPENLLKIYNALDRRATGKVCVKLSSGEKGNPNHLSPKLIAPLVQGLNATIVECNTAYPGARTNDSDHMEVAREHGFTQIAPFHLLDSVSSTALPVLDGRHIDYALIGKDWLDFNFTIVLSHFKGHPMAGFGGAIKNMGIGLQSREGKAWVHSAGRYTDPDKLWGADMPAQDDFLETMTEAAKAVTDYADTHILYINVANNLSVDCDCVAHPEPVKMADIGIFASLDPVAVDRACVDAVKSSNDHGKVHLEQRIAERNGTHALDYAEKLGLGNQKYVLIKIE
ncbi:MAG: DUF362 domain-containing protein [Bacteroides sp.]|nr:DUF362 domain-containing protein [Bacteroides sp.]